MDPVSILSVAAASFQFAELAVKSISKIAKICNDLEGIPKHIQDQLNDIQKSIARLQGFSAELKRDPAVSSIEFARLGSLTTAVDNWLATAADLESTLDHLLNPLTSKRHKWKALQIACKSLRQSSGIECQIQRLQNLGHEIWQELLRTLLANQLQIKAQVLGGEARIASSLRDAFQRLQDEQLSCKSYLAAAIQQEGVNTQTTLDKLTTSLDASFDQLSLRASHDQEFILGRMNAHVSEEFQSMRSFVSSVVRGNHSYSNQGSQTSNASPGIIRGGSLVTAQGNNPGIMSMTNAPAPPAPIVPFHQRICDPSQISSPCSCTGRSKMMWRVSKRLRLRYQVAKHVFPCPQSLMTQQFSSISIHVELPRFLGPSIEISMTTATQRTGYAFSQSLRSFPTVMRLDSPIFGEFDELQSLFQREDDVTPLEQIDIDAVRRIIRDLPMRLQRITATGAGSCRDKDEVGNTLLLETVYVMNSLKHRLREVSAELTQLLDFLRTVGLDSSSRGMQVLRSEFRYHGDGDMDGYRLCPQFGDNIGSWFHSKRHTAQSLAMIFAQEALEYYPIHSCLEGFEFEEYCSVDSSFPASSAGISAYGRSCRRQRAVLFFRLYPGLASELGSLEGAVARRDMAALKRILRKPSFDARGYKWKLILADLDLSAFQLAMDWQEGIEELLTKFAPTSEDIEFAIYINNPLSLTILKILWHRIRGSLDYTSIFEFLLKTSDSAGNQVIRLMQESRLKLYQVAMISLNDDEKERFCLTSHCPADWKTSEVWVTLMSQGCSVPLRYEPMRKDFLCYLLTTGGALDFWFQRGKYDHGQTYRSASELLQKFCDVGPLDVNCQPFESGPMRLNHIEAGLTPFVIFLDMFEDCHFYVGDWFPRFTEICLWFLNNGASAQDFGVHFPNLLFFLARFVALDSWHYDQRGYGSSYPVDLYGQQELWVTALERCSVEQSDACQCFCSVGGCLPSRLFLEPGGPSKYRLGAPRSVLDKRLVSWSSLCQLSEEQEARYVEDAVRLEVFDRLGMTHTCCVPSRESLWGEFQWGKFESDDTEEIQFEEFELKGHLDLIMEAYASFSRDFEDWNTGLSKWWMILEGILPGLSGPSQPQAWSSLFPSKEEYEHAIHDMEQDRAALEAQTLKSNGYEGMDFMDVIRLHFSEYLQVRNGGAVEGSHIWANMA